MFATDALKPDSRLVDQSSTVRKKRGSMIHHVSALDVRLIERKVSSQASCRPWDGMNWSKRPMRDKLVACAMNYNAWSYTSCRVLYSANSVRCFCFSAMFSCYRFNMELFTACIIEFNSFFPVSLTQKTHVWWMYVIIVAKCIRRMRGTSPKQAVILESLFVLEVSTLARL